MFSGVRFKWICEDFVIKFFREILSKNYSVILHYKVVIATIEDFIARVSVQLC